MKTSYMVPASATFNRGTGEITFQMVDDFESFKKFGEIMHRIGREHEHYLDREAREAYERDMKAHDEKMDALEKAAGI